MKTWIKKVFGFGLASFLSDFSHEMTVSLIPALVSGFVGPTQAPFVLGVISSTTDAFASFLRLFSGYISDKISHKKPLIAIGYGISAIFSTVTGFANSALQLLVYRTLSFTGSALREPPRDALIAASVEPKYYGRAFGLQRAMDTMGSLVGPLVAFVASSYLLFSPQSIFILSFIPGICAVFAIVFLTQDLVINARIKRMLIDWPNDIRLLPGSYYALLVIFFIFDLGNINKLLLLMRAQEILSYSHVNTVPIIVLLYAIYNATRAISEFLIGLLSDYINRQLLLALFGFAVLAIVSWLLMAASASLLYCAFLFFLGGISMAATTTLKKAIIADIIPADIRGCGFGMLQASEGFASLFSSALIGFLWTHYSVKLAFGYSMFLSTCATFLMLILIFSFRLKK
jgi:MFS family permease